MAYNSKAKIKVLYLLKILQEETDAEHGLTMPQIIERLDQYGIHAERKSVYADIKALREFDIDVRTYQRCPVEYAIERRDFALGELMLLVDAVQSCRAITDKQAQMLITNIKQLANNREQLLLDRRIHVRGRIKSKSESVLGTVDIIHEAIRLRCKLEFSYRRIVTPIAISYDDGFYYLSAWDEQYEDTAEYRLDRMARVRPLKDEKATRNPEIDRHSYDEDEAVMFGRFGGNEVTATLAVVPDKAGIIVDRFGKSAVFLAADDSMAHARVRICKSEQFFGWIAGMNNVVRIIGPDTLVEEYRAYLRHLLED